MTKGYSQYSGLRIGDRVKNFIGNLEGIVKAYGDRGEGIVYVLWDGDKETIQEESDFLVKIKKK